MTFNNPLYSAVTSQFFNFLANTMHQCFQDRCQEQFYSDPSAESSEDESIDHSSMITNYEEDRSAFPSNISHEQKLIKIMEQTQQKQVLAEINIKKEILASFKEQKNKSELTQELVSIYKNDKSKMREAEMLFKTFYDGGSENCKL